MEVCRMRMRLALLVRIKSMFRKLHEKFVTKRNKPIR